MQGTFIWRIKNHVRIEQERNWINFQNSKAPFLIAVYRGFKIRLYRGDLLTRSIYLKEYDQLEIKFLQQFLHAGDVFIDAGANIGLYSLVAASIVKKSGKVYSFEPSAKNYKKLQENISLNHFSNILPFCLGLSDKNEQKRLFEIDQGLGALSSYVSSSDQSVIVETEVVTLDDFVKTNGVPKINVIKVDVEGWEFPVISGAKELLENKDAPMLMVEFTDSNARLAGYSCQLVYDRLVDLGYILYRINKELKLIPESKLDYYEYSNVIGIKDGSQAHARIKSLLSI